MTSSSQQSPPVIQQTLHNAQPKGFDKKVSQSSTSVEVVKDCLTWDNSEKEEKVQSERSSNVVGRESTNSAESSSLTKDQIVQRLALLYSQKGMSLSALGGVAQLIRDLGYDIPIDPRKRLSGTVFDRNDGA